MREEFERIRAWQAEEGRVREVVVEYEQVLREMSEKISRYERKIIETRGRAGVPTEAS